MYYLNIMIFKQRKHSMKWGEEVILKRMMVYIYTHIDVYNYTTQIYPDDSNPEIRHPYTCSVVILIENKIGLWINFNTLQPLFT